jgi:hypothetical protein
MTAYRIITTQVIIFFCALITLPLFCSDTQLSDHTVANQELLVELANLNEICTTRSQSVDTIEKKAKKDWTIIFFIAADNDLQSFAVRNIRQMATIGSNDYVNIIVHLDIRISNKKVTKRFYIEKNNIVEVTGSNQPSTPMDSGDPHTLVSCVDWGVTNFPANHFMLVFWDHGTGYIDPTYSRIIKPTDLFTFNPETYKLELDRSIEFFDFIHASDNEQLGLCWDDSTGHYLTNQKIQSALSYIKKNILDKFDILAFDACLMGMAEFDDLIMDYGHICISSEEVELGTGWPYHRVLAPFVSGSISPVELAKHIVNVYEQTYSPLTNDFTLSAIDLDNFHYLERNIDRVAKLLLECIKQQKNNSVKKVLQNCRNRKVCTHFDEPSYLDLHHFYRNLQSQLSQFSFKDESTGATLKTHLATLLADGIYLIDRLVIANTTGKNLSQAKGISIYFPERKIHSSYAKSPFAAKNDWVTLLTNYLLLA